MRLPGKDAKTGYPRAFPLVAELRPIIERRIKARRLDCEYIFHRAGERMGDFRKAWATACKAAGLAVTEEDRRQDDHAPAQAPLRSPAHRAPQPRAGGR